MGNKSLIKNEKEIKEFLTSNNSIFHIKDKGSGTVLTYKVSSLKGNSAGFAVLYLIDKTFNYIGTIWRNKNIIKYTYSVKSYINPNSDGVYIFQDFMNYLAKDVDEIFYKYEFIKSENREEKKYVQDSN